ncbi:hypothetical protein AGMMS50268_14150 [Spirochaetia bacterium]|nr:hypothetical protein AGMMS50268_14150 [Spirochaetia bacterium]
MANNDVVYKDQYIWNRMKAEKNKRDHLIAFEVAAAATEDIFAVEVYCG